MRFLSLLAPLSIALVTATSASVSAQPGTPVDGPPPPPDAAPVQPYPQPPPPPMPPVAGPELNVDPGVMADANAGRVWFLPTAQTNPAGTWSIHDHELLLIGAGYSPTDRFQLGLSTVFPVTSDFPLILIGTAKYQLVRSGRLRVAGHLNLNHFSENDSDGDSERFSTSTVGGAATYCLDDGCYSLINGYLGAGFLLDSEADSSNVPFIASVGGVFKVAKRIRLVLEVNTGFVLGDFNESADGALIGYGVRFTSKNIGVDLGAIKPICEDCDEDVFPLGFPWVSFTYRDGRFL